jgi:hypothetical protein
MNAKQSPLLRDQRLIAWSATTYMAGSIASFPFFILMRFMLGGFESACNPASEKRKAEEALAAA